MLISKCVFNISNFILLIRFAILRRWQDFVIIMTMGKVSTGMFLTIYYSCNQVIWSIRVKKAWYNSQRIERRWKSLLIENSDWFFTFSIFSYIDHQLYTNNHFWYEPHASSRLRNLSLFIANYFDSDYFSIYEPSLVTYL